MQKLKLREWVVPSPIHLLRPEDVGELAIAWPVYKDDAHIDQLTELPNRRAFDQALSIAIKEATVQVAGFALIIFDLDHFKDVNDTYGHVSGDYVLQEFARRISKSLRSTDICSRYGGEEFSLLTVVSPGKVFEIGERVRLAVRQSPFSLPHNDPITVTCSFGCAVFPFNAVSGEELLEKADKALYRAKESGRDRGCQLSRLAPNGA